MVIISRDMDVGMVIANLDGEGTGCGSPMRISLCSYLITAMHPTAHLCPRRCMFVEEKELSAADFKAVTQKETNLVRTACDHQLSLLSLSLSLS